MKSNWKLEKKLRIEYNDYQLKANLEDRMTFLDYIQSLGTYKGHKIQIKQTYDLNLIILFKKI